MKQVIRTKEGSFNVTIEPTANAEDSITTGGEAFPPKKDPASQNPATQPPTDNLRGGPDGLEAPTTPTGNPGMGDSGMGGDGAGIMKAVEDMQQALMSLCSRMDKIENKGVEDNSQEVPTMERKRREAVHVGGDNDTSDFDKMDKKGKDDGATKDPENILQEKRKKLTAEYLRKMEDLTGIPEVPKGKDTAGNGSPKQTNPIPATKQPAVGTAPSGGGFDSNDKMGKDEENEAISELDKPNSDYSKPKIQKNALDDSLTAGTEEDPTQPQPGAIQKEPDAMKGAETKESAIDKLLREMKEDDEEETEEDEDEIMKELFQPEKKQFVPTSDLTSRQSVVSSARVNERVMNAPANPVGFTERMMDIDPELGEIKCETYNTVMEYLQKPGVADAVTRRKFGLY